MANEFFTLLTTTGKARLAAAQASSTPLQITHMAVGDGDNGSYYNPVESQTALKHETWRGALNNLSVDQSNPNWIVAELVIPDTVGGFYIREVGLFDSTGNLIAVGKFPESYKPTLASGSNKQLYVRMILEVSNAASVTLLVDPSVVLATRSTVDQRIAEELAKRDSKPSVKAATTAPITFSGVQTVDGVSLVAGDRVLVKDQATASDNGIYVVAASTWSRAADADASIEVTPGLFVFVEQGNIHADSLWQLVTDAPIALGTTALMWERVSGKTGVTAGTWRAVTVDQRGAVVGGTNPTTLAGYGITDAATPLGVQACTYIAAPASGTADALTASYSPAITALVDRMRLHIRAAAANTSATPTFTPNSGVIPAKAIVKGAGQPLVVGDIAGAGHWLQLVYDQILDKWVLLNPATGVTVVPPVPVGTILHVAQSTPPAGYLKANGAAVSRTAYPALFAALVTSAGFTPQTFTVSLANPAVFTKTAHGFTGGERLMLTTTGTLPTGLTATTSVYLVEVIDANTFYLREWGNRVVTSGTQSGTHSYLQSLYGLGDGTTTFNLPDLRGEFMRGWDDGRGLDTGRALGTMQNASEIAIYDNAVGNIPLTVVKNDDGTSTYMTSYSTNISAAAGRDMAYKKVRPHNLALLACIKY
ncbi:phage tail-collar fiber domain-containing protein [Leeia aquatica]|nr:phage tail protein [Leeia aquatica]